MRRRRRHDADEAEVQIPIPAMLDMTFQLLSFFILTFNPPHAGEGQVDMKLPAAGSAKAKEPDQMDPLAFSEKEVELAAEVTIAIQSANGAIDTITVREKEQSTRVADLAELRGLLRRLHQDVGRANIQLQADRPLKYAALVAIMDACLAAKFQSVAFAPPPDLGKDK